MFIGYSFLCHLAVLELGGKRYSTSSVYTTQFTSTVLFDWHRPTSSCPLYDWQWQSSLYLYILTSFSPPSFYVCTTNMKESCTYQNPQIILFIDNSCALRRWKVSPLHPNSIIFEHPLVPTCMDKWLPTALQHWLRITSSEAIKASYYLIEITMSRTCEMQVPPASQPSNRMRAVMEGLGFGEQPPNINEGSPIPSPPPQLLSLTVSDDSCGGGTGNVAKWTANIIRFSISCGHTNCRGHAHNTLWQFTEIHVWLVIWSVTYSNEQFN